MERIEGYSKFVLQDKGIVRTKEFLSQLTGISPNPIVSEVAAMVPVIQGKASTVITGPAVENDALPGIVGLDWMMHHCARIDTDPTHLGMWWSNARRERVWTPFVLAKGHIMWHLDVRSNGVTRMHDIMLAVDKADSKPFKPEY